MKICLCGRSQEAILKCGLCEDLYCKKCIEFLPSDAFSFMRVTPKELESRQFCLSCYADKVRPQLLNYNQIMNRAKNVLFLDRPRRQPISTLKKLKVPLEVKDCADREETILRLAFLAAELGYNSVIKANVSYRKVRNEGYQKMLWQGSGIAAELEEKSLLE